MRLRVIRLTAILATTLVASVVGAGAAFAQDTPNGQNGSTAPISTVATVLIFVGGPLTVMALGALITVPRRAVGALRYRPGRSWGYDREWFGPVPVGAGGPSLQLESSEATTGAPLQLTGGASADW